MERLIFNSKSCAAFGYRSFESPQQCSPKEGIEFIIYPSWLAGDSGAPNNTQKYTSPSRKSKHSILTHLSFTVTLSSLNATAKIVDARKSWTVDITWQKCTCKRRMQRCHSALFPKMLMAALELLLLKRLNGMVWSSMPCSKWSTGAREREKWRDLHHTFSSMRSQNAFTFLRSSQSHQPRNPSLRLFSSSQLLFAQVA